jgi:HK97 gp10 family phage protein
MPDIKVRVEGGEQLVRLLKDPEFVRGPLRNFLAKAGAVTELAMKEQAPVDTGRLRASIVPVLFATRVTIGPTVNYAPFVEFGTRPHWPPQGALQPWARRHGFPVGPLGDFLVRRAIALRGTKAQPFVGPGIRKALPQIRSLVADLGREIAAKWGRRSAV